MSTILTITESFSNESFDIASDVRTVKAFGYDSMPIVVNGCTRLEIASAMNEVYASGENLPSAVNVGILTSLDTVVGVAERLKRYKVDNLVVDPAIISDDGQILVTEEVFVALTNKLYPLATILTPNPYEVELLTEIEIKSKEDLVEATKSLSAKYRCAVFVKSYYTYGDDLLANGNEYIWLPRGVVVTPDKHSFAAAFACQLPDCESLEQAAISASHFVYGVPDNELGSKADIPFLTPKTVEQESHASVDIKPARKSIDVVVDIDTFTPEPVIDESLSKSLMELRAKLDKLR